MTSPRFDMSIWFEVAGAVILGLAIVGSVFWFAFRRAPERRSDGGLTQHDATYYSSGDYDGGGPSV